MTMRSKLPRLIPPQPVVCVDSCDGLITDVFDGPMLMVKRVGKLDYDTGFNQASDVLTGTMLMIKRVNMLDPDTGFNQATGDYLPLD